MYEFDGERVRLFEPPEFEPGSNTRYRIRGVHDNYYYDAGCYSYYSIYAYYNNDWSNYGYANWYTFAPNHRQSHSYDIRLQDSNSMYVSSEHLNGYYTKVQSAYRGKDWGDGVNRWKVEGVEGRLGPDGQPMYYI